MAINVEKLEAKARSSTLNQNQSNPNQSQGEVSQALAHNTAQVIRGQVNQTAQVVGELANQRELVTDHLSNQMAEILSPQSFWETVCAKTLQKLEGQAQPVPFELPTIDLPPMPEVATRYLQSSRQQYSSLPSEQVPVLAGASETQPQQQQPDQCESLNDYRKGAELPSLHSNGKPNPQRAASRGFEPTQEK